MSSGLFWKLKRLQAMGTREVLYRVGKAVQALAESKGVGLAKPSAPMGHSGEAWCKDISCDFDVERYKSAADKILAGKFDVFVMADTALGFPPNWNQDPKTQKIAPLSFGKTLNYRDENVVGDIKYLWEPNRHLALVTLAQAYKLTRNPQYAIGCKTLLDSWFTQCPYPLGVNWVSSLEHGVRLLNWSFAWHLLGGDESSLFADEAGGAFRKRWLAAIYQHCDFIAGHFSLYSSANNHLLGEYMGLLVGSLNWPHWPQSAAWQSIAAQGFEREAMRQTGTDGVNKEQAFYYHHEVMDMMVLCGLISRANDLALQPAYWNRLADMMHFLAAVMDRAGNVPMVGDADDAHMVHLSQEANWSHYRSLLATGAVLFGRGDLAMKAQHFDDKSRWLLGDKAAAEFVALVHPAQETPLTAFAEAGYFIMGARYGAPDEVRALIDCGPIGYLSIAAHGHADALALVLSAGGHELLVDPGTYAYHTQQKWRDYFRGTFAHNTVRVDGLDQSKIGGNFLWLRKANAICTGFDSGSTPQKFVGQHDGYQCLPDPVTHRRDVAFNADENCFDVVDFLQCKSAHGVEVCWHISEHCAVTIDGRLIKVTVGNVAMTLQMLDAALSPVLLSGQTDPPAGWISRKFDEKIPTNTLVWKGVINGDTRLHTRLTLSFGPKEE